MSVSASHGYLEQHPHKGLAVNLVCFTWTLWSVFWFCACGGGVLWVSQTRVKKMDRNGFTFVELADMHLAYGAALGNALEAQRLYHERYPNRRLPSRPMFTSVAQRLRGNATSLSALLGSGRP